MIRIIVFAVLFLALLPIADAEAGTTTIVVSGDSVPDGNGEFLRFSSLAINNAGLVVFRATMIGVSGTPGYPEGIFVGDGVARPKLIASQGQATPDGNGRFVGFSTPRLNESGQVAFRVSLGGMLDGDGIYIGDGVGGLVEIVREGQPAPDGRGTFSIFSLRESFSLNDLGQVAFIDSLDDSSDDRGVFRGESTNVPIQIAREGQSAPDGNGFFASFGTGVSASPGINDAGEVAFLASFRETSSAFMETTGIFRGDGMAEPVQIVRRNDASPDGAGYFDRFGLPAINDFGQVVFSAEMAGTNPSLSRGIYLGDGSAGLTQIVRSGDIAPDGNGWFDFLEPSYALNNAGQVVFHTRVRGATGGLFPNQDGIFRGERLSNLVQIARAGEAVPGGNGSFYEFGDPALNDLGQVAFRAQLAGTSGGSSDNHGIYFHDDAVGLVEVVRLGDRFLGSEISGFNLSSNVGYGEGRSSLNDLGQVAYSFRLADGTLGIAVWTLPEPSNAALILATFVQLSLVCSRVPCLRATAGRHALHGQNLQHAHLSETT